MPPSGTAAAGSGNSSGPLLPSAHLVGDIPEWPPPLLLSVSSMGRLAHCDEKFVRHMAAKDAGLDPDSTKGYWATLGTLLHLLVRESMFRRPWRPLWERLLSEEPYWTPEWEAPEHFQHAEWLMARWDEVHDNDPFWTLAGEVPFDLPLPGGNARIRGYIDGLDSAPELGPDEDPRSRPHGLFLDEIKSMGKWGKATRAKWEPQIPTYLWAARELGMPVTGCLFRAIGTMHKRTAQKPAPAADSFRDVWVPFNQAQVDKVLDDYRRATRRGQHLLEHPEDAVRNPGEACGWCPFKRDCLMLDAL